MIINLETKSLPETCYVFKHSTQCPISGDAAEEVRSAESNLPIYWINVIEQRDLSDWVESEYGLRHESPQLILIEGGTIKSSWSHRDVKSELFS